MQESILLVVSLIYVRCLQAFSWSADPMDNPAFSHESPTSVTSLPSAPAFTERQLRDALGQFATGVTIVTTSNAQGAPAGMTVSSFNAVSLDPPLVLWSLGQATALYPVFLRSQHYAIHVLALEQEDLARRFAAKGGDRFAQVDWQPNAEGVPIISGAVAVFECALRHRYAGGDHLIMVGEVLRCQRQGGEPLLYHAGQLGRRFAPQAGGDAAAAHGAAAANGTV